MPRKKVTVEDLNEAFVEAVHDDTPMAVATNSGKVVSGDTRRVGEARKVDYELEFWLPVPEDFDPAGSDLELVMGGTAYVQRVEAKQRFISARIGRRVRNYASRVAIAFTNFKEDGSTEVYTAEDFFKLYELFDDNVIEACENIIVEVLGVSTNLIQYITDESMMENVLKIMQNNPSFFQTN